MDLSNLLVEFQEDEIEWRISRSGIKDGKPWAKVLAYITNRAIMDRLDQVCEIGNWKNEFREWREKDVLCGISIRLNGDWVTKWDGAGETDIEAVKGGFSGAMKRAAVHWGIGRYLYNWSEAWAEFCENGKYMGVIKDSEGQKHYFRWNPPTKLDTTGGQRTTEVTKTTPKAAEKSTPPARKSKATTKSKKPKPTDDTPKTPGEPESREELVAAIKAILDNPVFMDGQRKSVENATNLVKDNTSLVNLKKVWEMRATQLEKQMEGKENA